VAEREPQDSVRARHRDLDGGRDTPPIANDEARPPTEAIELLERPLDHDLPVQPVAAGSAPTPGKSNEMTSAHFSSSGRIPHSSSVNAGTSSSLGRPT
jgi:hypothetical protein